MMRYNNHLTTIGSQLQTTSDYNRELRQLRRLRLLATVGTACFVFTVGVSLGLMVANGTPWPYVAAIAVWGVWGIHRLLTRHV